MRYGSRRRGDPAASGKAGSRLGWKTRRPGLADIVSDAGEFHRSVSGD
ncbi:hypothetical protein [Nocardia sputorum]|nr:hypothetical protein [Nocardia sputorum]